MMILRADGIKEWQLGMQDPATPVAEGIINFHNDLMIVMVFVVCFVTWMIMRIVSLFTKTTEAQGEVHGTTIEIVWTLVPAGVLMIIAVPSFALLYSVDEVVEPSVTVKVVGHQWYWSYEINNEDTTVEFDSYMLPESGLGKGDLRMLEVDNRLVLPVETHIRLVVTAADVLHSFAVPAFGVKMDCCPGRLNEVSVYIKRPGVYYGQCSELCGVGHSIMPIGVEVVPVEKYVEYIEASK